MATVYRLYFAEAEGVWFDEYNTLAEAKAARKEYQGLGEKREILIEQLEIELYVEQED